jgi:hypothetical protein
MERQVRQVQLDYKALLDLPVQQERTGRQAQAQELLGLAVEMLPSEHVMTQSISAQRKLSRVIILI